MNRLIKYAQDRDLFSPEDKTYITNRLLEVLQLDTPAPQLGESDANIESILNDLLNDAVSRGVITDTQGNRDLFDSKIMGCLTPPPSCVIKEFTTLLKTRSPEAATSWFYKFSEDCNYIRGERCARDIRWESGSKYGKLQLSINLSKPEKDPRDIAAVKSTEGTVKYPKCAICMENEGYAGRTDAAARQNLRIVPLTLGGNKWGMQYSPYVYYNEHCIVISEEHRPMSINADTFKNLLDFVHQFPHYFLGSNADLPIVGGSILTHEHYQGGNHTFPMDVADVVQQVHFDDYPEIEAGLLHWPLSVVRLKSKDISSLCTLADKIRSTWESYNDPSVDILASSQAGGRTERHNTITPIARFRDGRYEVDLVLRNNRTTSEHPLGLFHPHEELHHIKKENIGLIEVMGLAILPPRLNTTLSLVGKHLLSGKDLRLDPATAHHAPWAEGIARHRNLTPTNIESILRDEVALVFEQVLEHCGVFKQTEQGLSAFNRFLAKV